MPSHENQKIRPNPESSIIKFSNLTCFPEPYFTRAVARLVDASGRGQRRPHLHRYGVWTSRRRLKLHVVKIPHPGVHD